VGVLVGTVIPQLNDRHLEAILEAARQAGADDGGLDHACACRSEIAPLCFARGWTSTFRCAPRTS
jgi:DNA repair photolyase